MAKQKLLTEQQFIEKFKKEGFELFDVASVTEKYTHLAHLTEKERHTKEILKKGAKEIESLRASNKEKSLRLNMFDDVMALLRHDGFQRYNNCNGPIDVVTQMKNLSE